MPYTAPTPSAKVSTASEDTHSLSQKDKKDKHQRKLLVKGLFSEEPSLKNKVLIEGGEEQE